MTLNVKATDNNKVQIRKILVPIDGSECSVYAAKYATRIAKDDRYIVFTL
jgi:nucleotide-binding universal stress UspA family protein